MPLCPVGHLNHPENKFCSLCGSLIHRPLGVGDRVRQYQIESLISEGGGFSTTYLVTDTQLFDVKRVMKCMQCDSADENFTQHIFEHEARILASLNFASIPRVYAYFKENNHYYLIEDYIEGKTLHQLLQSRGAFSEAEIQPILKQMLDILDYLHSRTPPIIHRDIKPENMVMTPQGKLYLLDFGAVKESLKINRTSTTGKMSAAIYTQGYAPPEQLKGIVFLSTDIYALGVTLLHLLGNQHPTHFYDESRMEWLWKRFIHVSPRLTEILEKMTAIRPLDRYEKVADIRADLESEGKSASNLPVPTFSQEKDSLHLGKQHLYRAELDKALDVFQKLQQKNSRFIPAYIYIGDVYFEKELYEEAMFQYKKALQLDPSRADARLGLSITYYEKGNETKASEELSTAIQAFEQQLKQDGHDVIAGLGLAMAYTYQSKTHDAISLFRKLIRLDPENPDIYYNMGLAYYKSDQKEKAIDCFDKATLLYPHYVVAYNLLGLACFELQRMEDAIDAFKKAIQVNPLCDYIHNNLGLTYYALGDMPNAIREFTTALKLKPDYALAHYSLGLAFHRQGELSKAQIHFEETLRINPYFAYAHNNLGLVYYALDEVDKAINAYKKALSISPDFDYAHNNLGISYFARGQKDKAIRHLKKAIQLNPNYFDAHYNLGVTWYQLGEFTDALHELKISVQLNPRNADVYRQLGNTYFLLNQKDDALLSFERAIQLEPNNATCHYNLGVIQEAQGLHPEAVQSYIQTIQIDPRYATAYNNLGYMLTQRNKLDEAITCFKEALAVEPNLVLAHSNLGNAYYEKGLVDKALAEFEIASDLYAKLYDTTSDARRGGAETIDESMAPPPNTISFSS